MNTRDYVNQTFWEDCFKVARVNVLTGEYEFAKLAGMPHEAECLRAQTIFEYMRRACESGVIHPNDLENLRHFVDKDMFAQLLDRPHHKTMTDFRVHIGRGYTWVTLEILLPQNFSVINPVAVFIWKHAEEASGVEDAMRMLSCYFHKMLKVNLTDDSYDAIRTFEDEMTGEQGQIATISGWFREFAMAGNVMEADKESFLQFTDLNKLRETFRRTQEGISLRYRRRIGETFCWVTMKMIPAVDYSDSHQTVLLYIRDVNRSYVEELNRQRELELVSQYDNLTGLKNRSSLEQLVSGEANGVHTGVLYADLNDLKRKNLTLGYHVGDQYIQSFAGQLADEFGRNACYRLRGDGFVVVLQGMDEEAFEKRMRHFAEQICQNSTAVAAVGWAWSKGDIRFGELIRMAETRMQEDKRRFYTTRMSSENQ